MILSYPNLQANSANWLTQISTAINNPPSVDFIGANLPDGRLKVTNLARLPNAGGLVTWKQQPSPIANLTYAKLRTLIMVPITAIYNLRNLETDFIMVLKSGSGGAIPNKSNGSTRWNSVTGHFEADLSSGSPNWTDIGAGPGAITPNIAHELIVLYQYDLVKLLTSIKSISWDGIVYPVNSNTGVQTSDWGTVLAIQKQCAATFPGSVEVIYDQTELDLSDQPF